jgi:ferredoxin
MPHINRDICTGCKRCIEVCPTKALGQIEEKAALVFPSLCTYCTACETICPVNAIELPYLVCLSRHNGEQHE